MLDQELITALSAMAGRLSNSRDSDWATDSAEDLHSTLEALRRLETLTAADMRAMRNLRMPTGSLQEIAIDNSWGDEFLKLADVIDRWADGEAPL